ncbi:MAG: CHASE domain-containing protein, partial [Deltaproteobacteria bacterium]|nr:CHASE domain-containing protein [Deltaproteobacteria bacterium]
MISRLRPIILSALVFLFVLAMGGAFINLVESRRSDEKRQMLKEIGTAQAHLLERQLDRSLSSTFALASILRQSGRIDNFDALAAEMIRSYGGIGTLQLAPNGVVTQIYPMAGNEAAVGHDLLKDPRRRTESLAAIESRQLTLAGPFTLIQGGEAVIGRLPVFVSNEAGDERFWGFTIALIHLPDLLEVSNLTRLVKYGYDYELSRIDPSSGTRAVFARSTQAGLENTIPFEIKVPNGRWTLAVAPRGGWQSSSFLPVKIGLLFLVSALIAGFTYSLVRRPEVLRALVVFRTKELADSNATLRTEITERQRAEEALRESKENIQRLLETTKAIPWEANAKSWLFTYVGPQAVDLLGYPVDEWYHKDFWTSHIHPEDREYAIDFCLKSSSRLRDYEFEYRMIRSDGDIVWLHDIVNVESVDGAPKTLRGFMIDITERKLEAKQIQ